MPFINNRDHTRFDFRPEKWVKVLRKNQKVSEFKMFKIVDISKGGISFLVHSSSEFRRRDEFFVLEVEGKVFEEPIKAIVKYVKGMDEFGIDFKVGAEFLEKSGSTTRK